MAITFTNLGASATPDFSNDTNNTSYATSSWTPPTDGLILLFVWSREASGLNGPPTVSGNSITWTQIATVTFQSAAWRLTLFGANASGSSTGATTISFGADTQLCCDCSFFKAEDVDLSGGVAAAFVQSPTNSGTGTSGSVTLAAAGNSENRPVSAFVHDVNEAVTERTNWTEADGFNGVGPTRGANTQWRSDTFETTASASWATSGAWGGIAAELKASGGGGSSPAFKLSLLGVGK